MQRPSVLFLLLITLFLLACQKKTVPTTNDQVSPQKLVKDFVEQKEMKVKSVFKYKKIFAFDSQGNLLQEIQLDKANAYLIDISFAYDDEGRIKEEILLGDLLERPLKKFQYRYKENGERVVNRFHLDEKTKAWKPQRAMGQLSFDKDKKDYRRNGFRFKKKADQTDLKFLRDMTATSKVSAKEVRLAQDILLLVVYTDYTI